MPHLTWDVCCNPRCNTSIQCTFLYTRFYNTYYAQNTSELHHLCMLFIYCLYIIFLFFYNVLMC